MDDLFKHIPKQKYLRRLILKLKIQRMVKIWCKSRKNSKQRFYKLREWSETEKTYLEKLILLRDKVKKPLLDSQLITVLESQVIFANLEGMIQLAETMKELIDGLLATWHPVRTCLSKTVESLSNYLKIYKEYSTNFQKADAIIQELKKKVNYKDVVTVYNVEDYLIKPVQRPLQYKLFVQDYLKLLPPKHEDRERLGRSLTTLLKIADEINDHVEKQMRAEKMIRLEKTFGNLVRNAREYNCQFEAMTTEFPCRVYVFNDLLFIVRLQGESREQKHMYMNLCANSYTQLRPNNKIFKNRLLVCGTQQSIHLTFNDEHSVASSYSIITQLINDLRDKEIRRSLMMNKFKSVKVLDSNSKNKQPAYKWRQQREYRMGLAVEVVGVEKRLYQSEWKIVFAVRLRLGKPLEMAQLVFYELTELKNLQKYIKQMYPELQVPSLEAKLKGMSYEDFKVDFTKYFQYKSIIIEQFLNFCLRNKRICLKPEYIAYHLKIHECLWDYFNHATGQCKKCSQLPNIADMRDYHKYEQQSKQQPLQICMARTLQIENLMTAVLGPDQLAKLSPNQKLIWSLCKEGRIDYGLHSDVHFGRKISFSVYIKSLGSELQIHIQNASIYSTCRQVVAKVLLQKGIRESLDFGLVYVHGKYEFYLDDDEFIYDIVQHMDESYRVTETEKRVSLGNRASFLQTFIRSMDDYGDAFRDFSVKEEGKLQVRKIVKFKTEAELQICAKYPQRSDILLGELQRRVKTQIILLNNEEIRQLCGFFYAIQQFPRLSGSQQVYPTQQQLCSWLPEAKWSAMTQQLVMQCRQVAYDQVRAHPSVTLLREEILRQFGDKVGWQTEFFAADITDPGALNLAERSLMVGINPHKVFVCRRLNTMGLLNFSIAEFKYYVSGDCLFVLGSEREYRFIGNSWLLFQKLLRQYRDMGQSPGNPK